MREGKERIIYDNYDIEEQYRDAVLEDLEEGESLTEQEIWGRMYFFSQFDWDVARLELKSFFHLEHGFLREPLEDGMDVMQLAPYLKMKTF